MRYIFIIVLLVNIQWVGAQNIGIVYESENSFNHCNDKNLGIPEAPHITERGTLKICGRMSRFTKDSVMVQQSSAVNGTVYIPAMTVYKDYGSKTIHNVYDFGGDYYGFQKELGSDEDSEWEIDKTKTKKILGIDCYLAKKTQNRPRNCYEYAWFSEDIPFSDSFDKRHVGSLPGIILEYYSENRESYSYRAKDIIIYESCPFDAVPSYESKAMEKSEISGFMTSGTAEFPYYSVDEKTPLRVWFSN